MKLIGITGGVGRESHRCFPVWLPAAAAASCLRMRWETKSSCPDSPCYERLVELLGKDVLAEGRDH